MQVLSYLHGAIDMRLFVTIFAIAFASTANADLATYSIGPAPDAIDEIRLPDGTECVDILVIKGWLRLEHSNTAYKKDIVL